MKFPTTMIRTYPQGYTPDAANQKACSTGHELKIWFTKPGSSEGLGGFENEMRLIRAREQNTSHSILLVYEPRNLTPDAKTKVKDFCEKHNIQLMSLDDIESQLHAAYSRDAIDEESYTTQISLLGRARVECIHKNGNLAAASDIVRTLTPALAVGPIEGEHHGTRMYTDFDEPLSPDLPSEIGLEEDELMHTQYNNNCLIACNPEGQVLQYVRKKILDNYDPNNLHTIYGEIFESAIVSSVRRPSNIAHRIVSDAFVGQEGKPMKEQEFEVLPATQRHLNQVAERERFEPYEVNGLFALRQAFKDLRKGANENTRKFWNDVQLKTIVHMSGPCVFESDDKTPFIETVEEIPILQHRQGASDLSWVQGSNYEASKARREAFMSKSARTIQTAYKKHLDNLKEDPSQHEDEPEPEGPKGS